MNCDNCYWKHRYNNTDRCGAKGIYLYSSEVKREEEKFCVCYIPKVEKKGWKQ